MFNNVKCTHQFVVRRVIHYFEESSLYGFQPIALVGYETRLPNEAYVFDNWANVAFVKKKNVANQLAKWQKVKVSSKM
jgi:hypothetical protein